MRCIRNITAHLKFTIGCERQKPGKRLRSICNCDRRGKFLIFPTLTYASISFSLHSTYHSLMNPVVSQPLPYSNRFFFSFRRDQQNKFHFSTFYAYSGCQCNAKTKDRKEIKCIYPLLALAWMLTMIERSNQIYVRLAWNAEAVERKNANGKSNRETKRTIVVDDDINGEKKTVMRDRCKDAQNKHLPFKR